MEIYALGIDLGYIIGYLEVSRVGLATDFSNAKLDRYFGDNFHVRHRGNARMRVDVLKVNGGRRKEMIREVVKVMRISHFMRCALARTGKAYTFYRGP